MNIIIIIPHLLKVKEIVEQNLLFHLIKILVIIIIAFYFSLLES